MCALDIFKFVNVVGKKLSRITSNEIAQSDLSALPSDRSWCNCRENKVFISIVWTVARHVWETHMRAQLLGAWLLTTSSSAAQRELVQMEAEEWSRRDRREMKGHDARVGETWRDVQGHDEGQEERDENHSFCNKTAESLKWVINRKLVSCICTVELQRRYSIAGIGGMCNY